MLDSTGDFDLRVITLYSIYIQIFTNVPFGELHLLNGSQLKEVSRKYRWMKTGSKSGMICHMDTFCL